MRKIVVAQPCFSFYLYNDDKAVLDYRRKYDYISNFLDDHPEILNTVHKDLKQFASEQGKGAKFSSEQVFRMLLVKCIEHLPYREPVIRATESAFLRNFTRIGIGKVMSYGLLCSAYKNISTTTWDKINDLLNRIAFKEEKISKEAFRLDSTVCESNIHYPTDNSLLWDSYRVISRTIRECTEKNPQWSQGYRFHDKKIKQLYTFIATHSSKKNKSTKRKIKRYMRLLIERVDILCEKADEFVTTAKLKPCKDVSFNLSLDKLTEYISLGKHVVEQSTRSQVNGETVPASERIFSIFEPHTELLKRGKSRSPIEFGHLVTIGQTREKMITFYDVKEVSAHDTEMKNIALKAHKKLFGSLPNKFTADKNYHTSMQDTYDLEKKIELCAIGKKGKRSQEEYEREHSEQFKEMQRFRAGIEGNISVLKRAFGLRRCIFKGFRSFTASSGCLVFCHNRVLLSG